MLTAGQRNTLETWPVPTLLLLQSNERCLLVLRCQSPFGRREGSVTNACVDVQGARRSFHSQQYRELPRVAGAVDGGTGGLPEVSGGLPEGVRVP